MIRSLLTVELSGVICLPAACYRLNAYNARVVAQEINVPTDEPAEQADSLFCPDCGYNLRGLSGENCPECGYALDFARLKEPQLPWVHRRTQGRFRAYWKTVWMVTFKNRRFCEEFHRPVDYGQSQRFRWATIMHIVLLSILVAVILAALGAYAVAGWQLSPWEIFAASTAACALIAVFLLLATGLPSYFFHSKSLTVEQENRVIALSYYTSAPLAWMPVTLLLGAVLARTGTFIAPFPLLVSLELGATLLLIAPFLLWLHAIGRLAGRILRPSLRFQVMMNFGIALLWLLLAVLILVGLPLIFFYILIIFASL